MSDDGKNANDAKSAPGSKFESMSQEQLVKLVISQAALKKKLDAKISELSSSNVSLCQAQEQLDNELDDEKQKSKDLIIELKQSKINESKLQQELNTTRESSECLQLQNDSLKSSCKNLQDELSNAQNELSNLRLTINNFEQDSTNKLNESQDTIENLGSINEELKLELDHLRSTSSTFDKEKQFMEEQINNFRKQIEDFDLQKVEWEKFQQQSSELPIHQSNENFDQIISQRISSLLDHTGERKQHLSEELSDIPTLLPTIGITNYTNEDFSNPLNLESLLHLSSLLIERCQLLQNNDRSSLNRSTDKELVSMIQTDNYQQYQLSIHREDHSGLDTLFEHLYPWINQSTDSNDWQITLTKPIDKSDNQHIRLELNGFKFVSEQVEHELAQLHLQLDQLSKENEEQRQEINTLKENLYSSEQLKDQLVEQQRKILTLEEDLRSSEEQLTEQQQKIAILEENLRLSEQLQGQLAEEQRNTATLEEKLRGSEEQLAVQEQKITALEENLHSSGEQLAEQQRKITILEDQVRSYEQLKEQPTEQHQKIATLEETLRASEEQLTQQQQKITILEENLRLSEQLQDQLVEQQKKILSLEEELHSSEEQLEEHQRKVIALEENLHSSEEQLTEQQRKTSNLEEQVRSYEQLKEQPAEQHENIATLEETPRASEEQQQKIAILEENLRLSEQLQEQLAEEQRNSATLEAKLRGSEEQLALQERKITTLEENLHSSEQLKEQLAEQQRKIVTLEEDLHSSEEQLAEQQRKASNLEEQVHSYEQLKEQSTEQHQKIATLEGTLRASQEQLTEQQQKINILEENLRLSEQLKDQLVEQQRETSTLEENLHSSGEQLTEQKLKIAVLEEKLRSSEEQLAVQEQKITVLEENLHSSEQLKDQLAEQQRETSTLEASIRSSEQLKVQLAEQQLNIATLEENLRSSQEQLAEQREKTNELQNIINQGTIDKTKFDELESSYVELQQKNLLFEQIKSEYDLLKENFNTINLQLKEQQEINDKLKLDYEHQQLNLVKRDENIRLLNLEFEQQKQLLDKTNHDKDEKYLSLSKQQQQLSDLLETKINENKILTELKIQFENDLKENNQLFFEKTKQADDLDRQLQISTKEYENLKFKFDQLKDEKKKLMEKILNFEREKSEYIQINNNLKQELENKKFNFDQLMKKNEEKTQIEHQLQQTIENLKQELELTKTDFQNQQSNYIEEKQLTQTNNLQEENEKLNQTINELNQKIQQQTTECDDLKEKQQKMKNLLARLNKELQEKNQQPKQRLIDLELADYEKTIKTLKDDLTHKDKEIQDLRDDLTNLNEKHLSLKQEIENLEQQKSQTEERANKFKTLLDTTKKELQDAKDLEEERHHNDDNVRILIDKLQIELDTNKVTISQLLSDKQQLTERFNNQNETSQRTINLLEQNLRIAKHDLDVAKKDYETLEDDYNNYKIRAQSVLKQHQSTQRERVPSAVDRQTELEETIEKLKLTLQEAKNKIDLLISENEALQKEQDRLGEVQTKLINESRKREQDLRKQHQIELDKMQNECLTRTNDSHDMMKNVTLQNETLSATFKEQIASIETDHERSISILQNQLQASKQEIEQLKTRIESLRQTNIENEKEASQIGVINEFNKDDLPWTYAERQQGEGSESASVDYQSTDVAVKTLENVLFGNTANTRSSPSHMDKPRHVLFEDAELERQRVEEELNKTKYRLLNTTELLNESELNNLRLSEQVSLLKDEIRRMERNMERAESLSNLEYLKNIILKFFILKSTHERLQLIPVLVTMLKLSPDEQAKLVRVAQQTASVEDTAFNSESNTQQINNNLNANSSSWGSYLNMW